ncbi:unnamed protein product [Didymodactylos carnosus]|uniref:Uncharacterized protein n=1 Tax=Didymodactylos carnosus TaxID=1234261 RepID=A0A814Q0C5_9BILA|nr:unnamed protein product [Didymodactylos carnosus]CAF1112907.1 unnamed protein product [Didymodactylos carnosus]CAF3692801.1 unnamed protein product [Didymodactylos carnosus]CAF3877112.1 unnamed protein product [Didymodactylos carnosus]
MPRYSDMIRSDKSKETAEHYGGHEEIEKKIVQQFEQVNEFYNAEKRFNSYFNFTPGEFRYYREHGANENEMDYIDFNVPLADDGYNWRVIYSISPYGGVMKNMHSDYMNRSIRFAVNAEAQWSETIFGIIATRILCHELGHSRGAFDLYSVDLHKDKNTLWPGVYYNYPVGSIMNYLYDLSVSWDDHSIYCINEQTDNVITPKIWSNMFWTLFPKQFGVNATNMKGNPIVNANFQFYGIRWLSYTLNVAEDPPLQFYTDEGGKVTFSGEKSEIEKNPYRNSNHFSFFSNFLIIGQYQDEGLYSWLPVFTVQMAKINNQSEYYRNFTFNVKPTVKIDYPKTDLIITVPFMSSSLVDFCPQYIFSINLVILASAEDIDGSIEKVEFYNGNTLIGASINPGTDENYSGRYSHRLLIAMNGTYTLIAKAYDKLNVFSNSEPITVTVVSEQNSEKEAINDVINVQHLWCTKHAINFILYTLSGQDFRREFMKLFQCRWRPQNFNTLTPRKITTTSTTMTTSTTRNSVKVQTDNSYVYMTYSAAVAVEGKSLFGCFDDMKTCLCGYFCLPCLFGQNAESIDGSSCVGMGILYCCLQGCYACGLLHMGKRQALRAKYNLAEEPADLVAACCCGPCAVCQEAREMQSRGNHMRSALGGNQSAITSQPIR